MFKFYKDAVKFVGVLACLATIGMIFSAATLIVKQVSLLTSFLHLFVCLFLLFVTLVVIGLVLAVAVSFAVVVVLVPAAMTIRSI